VQFCSGFHSCMIMFELSPQSPPSFYSKVTKFGRFWADRQQPCPPPNNVNIPQLPFKSKHHQPPSSLVNTSNICCFYYYFENYWILLFFFSFCSSFNCFRTDDDNIFIEIYILKWLSVFYSSLVEFALHLFLLFSLKCLKSHNWIAPNAC